MSLINKNYQSQLNKKHIINKQLPLYKVLKIGYSNNENKKINGLKKFGYRYDKDLSNNNNNVYYNPTNKKLLLNVKGTNPLSPDDLLTDVKLAFGGLKSTNRYKDSDKILKESKKKYGVDSSIITGHSLGGSIAMGIGSKNDKIIGLDSGYTAFQKTRNNTTSLRTAGDVVSLLGVNGKHVKTLQNNNIKSGFLPIDALISHDINNIKGKAIFI